MEDLERKYQKFTKSLKALEKSIHTYSSHSTSDIQQSLVASNIKHFEFCYESTWKFLQSYLEYKYDQKLNSPKKIFRECFALGIIDNNITKILLDISEARNATVHEYDEETAQEICHRINGYYKILKELEHLIRI